MNNINYYGKCRKETKVPLRNEKFKNMHKEKSTGDWRRDTKLHNLHHVNATINRTNTSKNSLKHCPVPVGMEGLLRKSESTHRSFRYIPVAIKEEFGLAEPSYNPRDYSVTFIFLDSVCTLKNNLRENFWMKHWDQLNLSWNSQDVAGASSLTTLSIMFWLMLK